MNRLPIIELRRRVENEWEGTFAKTVRALAEDLLSDGLPVEVAIELRPDADRDGCSDMLVGIENDRVLLFRNLREVDIEDVRALSVF